MEEGMEENEDLRLTDREMLLVEEFSRRKRGHSVVCRFCGTFSSDHALRDERLGRLMDPDAEWEVKLGGFRVALLDCPGYVPKNLRKWDKAEAEFAKSEERESRYRYTD